EYMCDIDLPGAAEHAGGRDHEAPLQHGAAIHEGRGVAGDEDEDFGGVRKSVVADGQPGEQARRQVVDEDQPQRKPTEQVEPELALADHRQRDRRRFCRGGRLARGFLRPFGSLRPRNLICNGRHQAPCQGTAQNAGSGKDFTGRSPVSKVMKFRKATVARGPWIGTVLTAMAVAAPAGRWFLRKFSVMMAPCIAPSPARSKSPSNQISCRIARPLSIRAISGPTPSSSPIPAKRRCSSARGTGSLPTPRASGRRSAAKAWSASSPCLVPASTSNTRQACRSRPHPAS